MRGAFGAPLRLRGEHNAARAQQVEEHGAIAVIARPANYHDFLTLRQATRCGTLIAQLRKRMSY